ncbi:unnamed protein product [Zymoseptoria tritici ST99CH_1E4]|uniref:FAD/NAD(P)-binding domain-containing protein n=1 Tax=Zymoseptoria tritici ST99CH_1E4 TaxID=1276532 RepID=A0A2H1H8Q1_ZYMTR|nr:unnamed protein product [Zymoseptoria tritici ST99CH_1E4]
MAHTNGTSGAQTNDANAAPDYDCLVIGAGFAGLRIIPELRRLGLTYKIVEAGASPGGTWYWNRYPGARTDTESWVYILNVSPEINEEWTWKERFPRQPEVEAYLNFVADKLDVKKDIQFNARVKSAHWDDEKGLWNFETQNGEKYRSRFFLSATGLLSVGRHLPFHGHENFKGESYISSAWPKHDVSFKGKRVAVIGTGATAVQIIPMVAHEAKTLTVFQRTANFVLPARNHPLTAEQQRSIKGRYDEVWKGACSQIFGMDMVDSQQVMMEMHDEKKIRRVLENGWEVGGFRYIFETFADLLTSQQANDVASDFVREKIRSLVKDEETAEILCPDHGLMGKRPPLGHHYFETFNKPHVTLVDVKNNPIKEITEKGVQLTDKDPRTGTDEFEFDMIIYAIGFDAGTGALVNMDVRGKDNRSLGEEWNKELQTFLGIANDGFPNLLMMCAPQSPFANLPVALDKQADFIGKTLERMQRDNCGRVEPKKEAVEGWTKMITDVYEGTVLPAMATKAGSWYIGANVPGKRVAPLFWFGGVSGYRRFCDGEVTNGFPSLTMA